LDKCEGYAANLTIHDYENNLQEAIPKELPYIISSGYVYSDVDLACQYPALHLILTIMNMESDQFQREAIVAANTDSSSYYLEDILIICYYLDGYLVLMNDWQDTDYFIGSFLTLFPLGTGGHISTP
jgi:hypothetical protein